MGIRDVRDDDARGFVPLLAELGYPTTEEDLRPRLVRFRQDPAYQGWVYERADEVVGFGAGHAIYPIENDLPAAQLIALVTFSDEAGQGIGGDIALQFERWARGAGAGRLLINCGAHRSQTHGFYERRGYQATGLRFNKSL